MKAFVTGGTGFIGSHLVDYLIGSQYVDVNCLVRKDEKWLKGKAFTRTIGNINDIEALKKGMKGADVVFHLAALVKAPNWQMFKTANIDAVEDIVRLAQKMKIPKVVILSSLAAAGPSNGTPKTESDSLHPVSFYGKSKKIMEERIAEIATENDSISIIRPPAVYGPREENIFGFFRAANRGICPIIGNGKHPQISMIHVSDLVEGIWLASRYKHKSVETFFISSDEYYNWNRIKAATAKALGRKLYSLNIKPGLVYRIGALTETIGKLFGKYPILNKDKAVELSLEWTCSIEKAQKLLGFNPKFDIESGIEHTINWYKKHHWL